jgi:hypothetical protein
VIVEEDQAMTTRVSTFPLRLPVSLKTALEKITEQDGTSINQFLVVARCGEDCCHANRRILSRPA